MWRGEVGVTGVFSFRISVKPHKRCVCVAGENTSVLCLKGQWLVAEQQKKKFVDNGRYSSWLPVRHNKQ